MRNPEHIEELIELIREVWSQNPDQRFGQLIFNAARSVEPNLTDMFNIEDARIRKGLIRYRDARNAVKGIDN
jgi:hypothetical protein